MSDNWIPLDSEVKKIGEIWASLKSREGSVLNLDAFQREAKERFYQAGFRVNVLWYETNQSGVYIPELEVLGPVDKKDFDFDKMTHEVTHDILGTGEKGVIKEDGTLGEASKSVSFG